MRTGVSGWALSIALSVVGCQEPQRSPPVRSETGKQALYGDARLVPTREGERVRRELALAGEIGAALELLELGPAHVDVELGRATNSVVVVARAPADVDQDALEATVVELSAAIVPELEPDAIHVWLRPRASVEAPKPRPARPWALVFACLGLGLSLGVTIERARARRR
ncbi:hypothetical protein ENSA5_19850 [Enhygromyxa salina]|uniref:Uncharacterized protein n=1 Tax=Enhygromyxa salina TaxID=215803 RepID=A0A2S9YCR8_9BACT|nr:hypothetical protein [Enhygromyxa salina]PRQ02895.1 hypothetical protein ENSA5_19850 [Enhygromyxa salina]